MRKITELKPEEVIRLAISVEDRNEKVYLEYAAIFKEYEPKASRVFEEMANDEHGHGDLLREFYRKKFGTLPPEDFMEEIEEPVEAPILPDSEVFVFDGMTPQKAFDVSKRTEILAQNFYADLAKTASDPDLRTLFTELEQIEKGHLDDAEKHERAFMEKEQKKG